MDLKNKIYSSYDEINRDLEILDLERKLHYLKVAKSIENLGENITIANLADGLLSQNSKHSDNNSLWNKAFKVATPLLLKKVLQLIFK